MIRASVASLFVFAAASPAFAQVKVSGDWVTLGDVAPVTGDAAKLLIAQAPPEGQTLALDPAFVVAAAKKAGKILALPDEPLLVTRESKALAGGAPPPAPPVAPVAPQARQASQPSGLALQGVDGQVLVLVRDVARGAKLTENDLTWSDAGTVRPGRTPPQDLQSALGLEAKRPLKAGVAVQMSDLTAPSVVKKNEPVKLVYVSPGMRLSVDGKALNDAAMGESVRVLNSFSKRTIEAVATAEGEARVGK